MPIIASATFLHYTLRRFSQQCLSTLHPLHGYKIVLFLQKFNLIDLPNLPTLKMIDPKFEMDRGSADLNYLIFSCPDIALEDAGFWYGFDEFDYEELE